MSICSQWDFGAESVCESESGASLMTTINKPNIEDFVATRSATKYPWLQTFDKFLTTQQFKTNFGMIFLQIRLYVI